MLDPGPSMVILGGTVFRRHWGPEDSILTNMTRVFVTKAPENQRTTPPSSERGNSTSVAILASGSKPSPESESARTMSLDFLASRTFSFSCLKPSYSSPRGLKQRRKVSTCLWEAEDGELIYPRGQPRQYSKPLSQQQDSKSTHTGWLYNSDVLENINKIQCIKFSIN